MRRAREVSIIASAIFVVAFTGACSGDDATRQGTQPSPAGSGVHHSEAGDAEYDFGFPGDVMRIDRVIKVVQLDSFRFKPDNLSISAGDTVRFQIFNQGTLPHEFVIGDKEFQAEHERLMAEMGDEMLADSPNGVSVDPGARKSLTWTFTKVGTVFFACHVSGHYSAGMVGSVQVAS
jgi:uncharacterized cupredoxin-like copper-binding protein